MKSNISYNKAFSDLEKLVDQIEDDEIQLDTLADKVKQANDLIKFCETKLRTIEKDVKTALTADKPNGRKKNIS